MRVLICATEYYPNGSGIANVAFNVVRELESMGVECTVCSPTGPDIKLGDPDKSEKIWDPGHVALLESGFQAFSDQ